MFYSSSNSSEVKDSQGTRVQKVKESLCWKCWVETLLSSHRYHFPQNICSFFQGWHTIFFIANVRNGARRPSSCSRLGRVDYNHFQLIKFPIYFLIIFFCKVRTEGSTDFNRQCRPYFNSHQYCDHCWQRSSSSHFHRLAPWCSRREKVSEHVVVFLLCTIKEKDDYFVHTCCAIKESPW